VEASDFGDAENDELDGDFTLSSLSCDVKLFRGDILCVYWGSVAICGAHTCRAGSMGSSTKDQCVQCRVCLNREEKF